MLLLEWGAFGGAVRVAERLAVSACMLATVERPASTEESLIKARVLFSSHAPPPLRQTLSTESEPLVTKLDGI